MTHLQLSFNEDRYPVVECAATFSQATRREFRERLRDAGSQGIEVLAVHMPRPDYDAMRAELRRELHLFQLPLCRFYGIPISGQTISEMRIYGEKKRQPYEVEA